ncbi:hypothetical protein CDV55_103629 [Aspergillus turcosus]|uniref:Uncharacterized protein n=1 Tax=Aspergillus turcosus TaxID=1245748 RepID=A0A229XEE3_9EURO|nr:hypothetical protein CDV55_103629 [Aspergillus turcosus]RLL97296.1 hypothetical protein CFD26_104000 [Aspergillus turcosus]
MPANVTWQETMEMVAALLNEDPKKGLPKNRVIPFAQDGTEMYLANAVHKDGSLLSRIFANTRQILDFLRVSFPLSLSSLIVSAFSPEFHASIPTMRSLRGSINTGLPPPMIESCAYPMDMNGHPPSPGPALHIDGNPVKLSLRDLSGWPSASAMTKARFLTTRILWTFVTKDEPDKQVIEKFPKTVTSYVEWFKTVTSIYFVSERP